MNPAQLIENRSSLLIFRDCLKLAPRMVDNPLKTKAVRMLMKQEFAKHRDVVDQQQIRQLKLKVARAISNYIIYTVKSQYNLKENKTIYDAEEEEDDIEHTHHEHTQEHHPHHMS